MAIDVEHLMNTADDYVSPTADIPKKKYRANWGDVRIFDDVYIADGAVIGDNSLIANRVIVGAGVVIGRETLILDDAKVCPDEVVPQSSNARHIGRGSIIGCGVFLDNEVELGSYSIVPTNDTIKSIGRFGNKGRTLTIYGTQHGFPLISVGCNVGVPFGDIERNVEMSTHTEESSANSYKPYLPLFREIGEVVQEAFNDNLDLVSDLVEAHRELILFPSM